MRKLFALLLISLFLIGHSSDAAACAFGSSIAGGGCRGFVAAGTTSFTIPSDWNSAHNSIEIIAEGGSGGVGCSSGGCQGQSGGAGGSGAYCILSNYSSTGGTVITTVLPVSTTQAVATFNNSTTLKVDYGRNATAFTGGIGGLAANSVGTACVNGTTGANGNASAFSYQGGAGGTGSPGPTGVGKAGGSPSSGGGGAGGGGSNGGSSTAGSSNSGSTGGAAGLGTAGTTVGGGGIGGSGSAGATGSCDTTWDVSHGACGGAGAASINQGSTTNGLTPGTGGPGNSQGFAAGTPATGGNTLMVVTYYPTSGPATTSPFFMGPF